MAHNDPLCTLWHNPCNNRPRETEALFILLEQRHILDGALGTIVPLHQERVEPLPQLDVLRHAHALIHLNPSKPF